jgi:carbonic anhydrase
MALIDDILEHNRRYAAAFPHGSLPVRPARGVAILACMDARLDVFGALGLAPGDAHVIRNAGGLATDDAVRSLIISSRLLGTREFLVVEHTDCGMLTFRDADLQRRLAAETGADASGLAFGAFADLEENLRRQVAAIRENPFLPADAAVGGLIYDVTTGLLREVVPAAGERAA